jgi:hypothetical protein
VQLSCWQPQNSPKSSTQLRFASTAQVFDSRPRCESSVEGIFAVKGVGQLERELASRDAKDRQHFRLVVVVIDRVCDEG